MFWDSKFADLHHAFRTWTLRLLALLLLVGSQGCSTWTAFDRNLSGGDWVAPAQNPAGAAMTWIDVPLTVHYATRDGLPVVSRDDVESSVRRANRALIPYGIRLYISATRLLPSGYERVVSSDDRLALAEIAQKNGTINVFFVHRVALFNPRRGDARVSGMHWRYHGLHHRLRQREYLVVAHDAPSTTLVHEVGHAFGLGHSRAIDNLMCSCRRGDTPDFTKRQGRRMRAGARVFMLRSH